MAHRITQPWSRSPAPGISVFIATIALLGFLSLTAAVLFFPAFQATDARLSDVLRNLSFPGLESAALVLTFLGSGLAMSVLTLAVMGFLLSRGRPAEAALLGATMVIGTVLGSVLKTVIERARPGFDLARIPVPESYSFPSGHALAAFLFFGVLAFLVFILAPSARVKLIGGLVCSLLVAGVAFSRVYLGVHYLGDVIASWMLGSALLVVAIAMYVGWATREQPR